MMIYVLKNTFCELIMKKIPFLTAANFYGEWIPSSFFFSYDINIPIMVLILYCLAVILFFPKEKCSRSEKKMPVIFEKHFLKLLKNLLEHV